MCVCVSVCVCMRMISIILCSLAHTCLKILFLKGTKKTQVGHFRRSIFFVYKTQSLLSRVDYLPLQYTLAGRAFYDRGSISCLPELKLPWGLGLSVIVQTPAAAKAANFSGKQFNCYAEHMAPLLPTHVCRMQIFSKWPTICRCFKRHTCRAASPLTPEASACLCSHLDCLFSPYSSNAPAYPFHLYPFSRSALRGLWAAQ